MILNLIDKLGDWNPQILRELKGRLKVFPMTIALVTSLAVQLIIFLYQLRDFPSEDYRASSKYCNLNKVLKSYSKIEFCPADQIDMQLWWRDHWEYIFLALSVIFILMLLVGGTYLIVNDLAQEERRGTLNFIRLTPQSETSIFLGKLLGVPVLIYLVFIAAIPFHIFAGKLADISFSNISFFYIILIASCILFYSLALLFGIFGGSAFSGFRPWLASGLLLMFLIISIQMGEENSYQSDIALFRMFSPFDMTDYLFPNLFNNYRGTALSKLQFYHLHLGENVLSVLGLHIFNYALWTYWAWQGLKRCFRNPNATLFSKQQSYWIVGCFEFLILGFFLSEYWNGSGLYQKSSRLDFFGDITAFYVWNLLVFVGLFAAILPQRQNIQDWARFRYQTVTNNTKSTKKSLFLDLVRGEKTPGILAIAINLLIAASAFVLIIFNSKSYFFNHNYEILGFFGILLFLVSTMIYATIAQIMLMLKNSKRTLWAMGATTAAIILPILILAILDVRASNSEAIASTLWLFSSGFWYGVEHCTLFPFLIALICQLTILGLLNWYLINQVKSAGESATKELFSQSKINI